MKKVEKILIPLDGSNCSERVLPEVEKFATESNATLALLRVAFAYPFTGVDPIDAEVKAIREAEDYLQRIEDQLKAKGLKVESHVRYGQEADEILDHASQKDIDLIAMATQDGSWIKRFLYGNVAEKVHRNSTKPVFLVRCV